MGMTHLQLQDAVVSITGRSDKKTSGDITTALNLAQDNAMTQSDFERLRSSYSTGVVVGDSSFTPTPERGLASPTLAPLALRPCFFLLKLML